MIEPCYLLAWMRDSFEHLLPLSSDVKTCLPIILHNLQLHLSHNTEAAAEGTLTKNKLLLSDLNSNYTQ